MRVRDRYTRVKQTMTSFDHCGATTRVQHYLVFLFSFIGIWSIASQPLSINLSVSAGFDGQPIWIGIEDEAGTIVWSVYDSPEISIEISSDQSVTQLVILKKNALPIVQVVTAETVEQGLTIDFSKGTTIHGSVTTRKEGIPITDGEASIRFDEELTVHFPEEESLFSWDLEPDGTFLMHGIPPGEHTVSVRSSGYMLAKELVVVIEPESQPEVNLRLDRAVYMSGIIVDYADSQYGYPILKGEISAKTSLPERQTEPAHTRFDNEKKFTVGPFPEDVKVTLKASVSDGRHSWAIKESAPAENIKLMVQRWVRVFGTVHDQNTGSPVTKFNVVTSFNPTEFSSPDGSFSYEIGERSGDISIDAPGYLYWTMTDTKRLSQVEEYDLGSIQLIPSHTAYGRVIAKDTGEPISGATVRRNDGGSVDAGIDRRSNWIRGWNMFRVTTNTDEEGRFALEGFPREDALIWAIADGYDAETLTISDIEEFIEFKLDPIGAIVGQVVSIDGEPVPRARIHYPFGMSRADEDGNFHFKVGAGVHRYRAAAESGRSEIVEIETEAGEVIEDVQIVLDIVGRVHGVIDGLLENESVSIGADRAGSHFYSNGRYEFYGVSIGQHEISCTTSFGRRYTRTIDMDESQEVLFDVTFKGVLSLSGRVFIGNGGLPGHEIILRPDDPKVPQAKTTTSGDGSYRFEALVPGNYTVEVPTRAFSKRIGIREDVQLDFQMGTHTLQGSLNASGSVRGAELQLTGGPPERELVSGIRTTIDAAGEFRFDGLPSGSYVLHITHPGFTAKSLQVELVGQTVDFDVFLDDKSD